MPSIFAIFAATAALIFAKVDGHGKMTCPVIRSVTKLFRESCGALINIGDEQLTIAPLENLAGFKQADFPPSPTFNLMNGCRGTVYEKGNNVTNLKAGKPFDFKYWIQAPHPGYMRLSVVKPTTDSKGIINYKVYKEVMKLDSFATNGGDQSAPATMPADVTECAEPGECVLQMYWHSDRDSQTYASCADITVTGGSGGKPSKPATPAKSVKQAKPAPSTPPSPTPAPAPAAVKANPSISVTQSEVGADAEHTGKCIRRN